MPQALYSHLKIKSMLVYFEYIKHILAMVAGSFLDFSQKRGKKEKKEYEKRKKRFQGCKKPLINDSFGLCFFNILKKFIN